MDRRGVELHATLVGRICLGGGGGGGMNRTEEGGRSWSVGYTRIRNLFPFKHVHV